MKKLSKRQGVILAASLAVGATVAFSATPAFAVETIDDGIYTIGSKQGTQVIDVVSGSTKNGASLQTYEANGTLAQAFYVRYQPEHDAYTIVNVHSAKALGIENGSAYVGNINQYDYLGNESQRWKFIPGSTNGEWAIQSCTYPYSYLDVMGERLKLSASPKYWRLSGEFQSGQTIQDGTYVIQKKGTNRVLDIRNGSIANQAPLMVNRYNGTPAQLFTFKYLPESETYVITNDKSGRAIDRPNGYTKTELWQYLKNDSKAQQWHIYKNGGGHYIICSADSDYGMVGYTVDDNTFVDQAVRVQTEYPELWDIIPADEYELPYATYQIYSAAGYLTQNTTKIQKRGNYKVKAVTTSRGYYSLDIPNASRKAGANVQLYRSNGTLAQAWIVNRTPRGYYLITNVASGKALDVQSAGQKNGTNVWQYDGNGTTAQRWDITFDDNGYATITSKLSGKALDVTNAKYKNGTNIQLWTSNETKAQKWIITDMKQRTISVTNETVVK